MSTRIAPIDAESREIVCSGVSEYNEEMDVNISVVEYEANELKRHDGSVFISERYALAKGKLPRLSIHAFNEGGYNSTQVDLQDLMVWIANHPDAQPVRDRLGVAGVYIEVQPG